MAKHIPKPFITRIQAEGTAAEKNLEKMEILAQAKKLAADMPMGPQRQVYVSNLIQRVLRKQVDIEVFKEFVKLTNSWLEVEATMPRARILVERRER
jgi:hypothetical protein